MWPTSPRTPKPHTKKREKIYKIGKDAKYRQNPLWKRETKLMTVASSASTLKHQRPYSADPLHHCSPPSQTPHKRLLRQTSLYFLFNHLFSIFPITSSALSSSLAFLILSSTKFLWPLRRSRKRLTLIYFTDKHLLSSYLLH